ncbi:hypothetical protein ACFL43_01635 [Thermodesulfobacteriota bacterium]
MSSGHDDYEDKPSWSEIDKRKDQSRHVAQDEPDARPKSPKKEWAQKMYLKEIENLFKGKKASKEHAVAIGEIHQRAGTKKFNTSVKKYIKEYGLPDDWSTLFLLLDYKEIKIIKQAIEALKALGHEESLSKKEGLKSKLNIISMTTTDDDLREIAEEALEDL